MRRRLAAWILMIIIALILYIFSNESVTLALLIALIAALPASFAVLRLTSGQLEFAIRDDGSDGENSNFVLSMKNNGVLPVAYAEVEVKCVNLRTGETDSCIVQRGIMPKRVSEQKLGLKAVHAGRYELSVVTSMVTDPLGIWKREVPCEGSMAVTVLPEIFDMQMLSAGGAAMPESDMETQKTVGAVGGDMIGIREYVPGDPVRNIHWKLSEKTDKILVKELGNPVTDQYLILLDGTPELAHDPASLDVVASVYTSLIHTLRQKDMLVYAGWSDPQIEEQVVRMIATEEDLAAAADEYLAVPASIPGSLRSTERYMTGARFAHIVIVGSGVPSNIDDITNGCQATVLVYGGESSFTERNLTVIGLEPGTYKVDTAGIEI